MELALACCCFGGFPMGEAAGLQIDLVGREQEKD